MKTLLKSSILIALATALCACQQTDSYAPSLPPGADQPDIAEASAAGIAQTAGLQIVLSCGDDLRVPVHGQTYRYSFEAALTLPDGTVVRSSDPGWCQSFEWRPLCAELHDRGDGSFELDARKPGVYTLSCTFDQMLSKEISIEVFEPDYVLAGHSGTRTEGTSVDHLNVQVTIEMKDPETGKTIGTFSETCPYLSGLSYGNLYVMTAYDCVEAGLWSGCGSSVSHGTAARYYVYAWTGTNRCETFGPTTL